MKHIFVAFLLTAIALAMGAVPAKSAAPVPILVELFTSEGCSSCPPADALLETLDRTQPVPGAHLIVLSEHVDYWNSLGWKDPFSSAQFTARQSGYARRNDPSASVYTPNIVVDGRDSVVGSDANAVSAAIANAARSAKAPLAIDRAKRMTGQIALHVHGEALAAPADLYVAVAYDRARSNVTGGENGGRLLTHVAVVHSLTHAATFRGGERIDEDVSIAAPASNAGRLRIVAFLQDARSGAVLEVASSANPF